MRRDDCTPSQLLELAPVDQAHVYITHKTAPVTDHQESELRERFVAANSADEWNTARDVVAEARDRLGPHNALWMIWEALILIAHDEFDAAYKQLLLALPFSSGDRQRAAILVNLSLVELKRGDYLKTATWCRLAIENEPLNQAAWINFLIALIGLGDKARLLHAVERLTTIFDVSKADQLRYHLANDPDLAEIRSLPSLQRVLRPM